MNEVILRRWTPFEVVNGHISFLQGMRISNTMMLDKYFRFSCQILAFYKPDEIFIRFISRQYEFCDYYILPANLFEEVLIRSENIITVLELRNMRIGNYDPHPVVEENVDWLKEGF